MHYAVRVGLLQGLCNLDRVSDRILHVLHRDDLVECFSLHVLHHDRPLALMFSHIMNGTDIGMVEDCSGAGFLKEPCPFRLMGIETVQEKLQGYRAGKLEILSLVDDPHAPFPGFFENHGTLAH